MAVELPKVDGADPQKVWRDIAIAANAAGVSGTRMGKAYEEAAKVMAGRMSELEKRFRVGEASQAGYNASMQNIVKTFENGKKLIEQYESPLEKYRRKLAEISEAQQSGIIDQKTYNAALADMKSELDDTEKHFGMSRTAILAWGSSAVEAGSAVARELVRTAESISETAKAAESAGVSSKGFVELGYAAKQAGVDAGMLNGAFIEINDSIVNSSDKFTELGIKVKDTAGNFRSADEVLYDLADNLSGAAVGSKESAAAMELLGKHNAALLPMFKDGSEGLRKMADEAQRLGLVFDKDTGHAAELFSANMTRLSSISDGLRIQITSGLLPGMVGITDAMAAAAMDADFMGNTVDTLTNIIKGFTVGGIALYGVLRTLADVISTILANAMEIVATEIRIAVAGFQTLGDIAGKVLKGDLIGAAQAAGAGLKNMWGEGVQGAKNIGQQWSDTANGLSDTWGCAAKMMDGILNPNMAGLETMKKAQDALKTSTDDLKKSEEELKKLRSDGAQLTAQMMTAQEKLSAELDKYNNLLKAGAINRETYDRAALASVETYVGASRDALLGGLDTEYDAILKSYEDRQGVIDKALDKKLLSEEEHYKLSQKYGDEYQAAFLAQIEKEAGAVDKLIAPLRTQEEAVKASYDNRLKEIEQSLQGRADLEEQYGEALRANALENFEKEKVALEEARQSGIDSYMDVLLTEEQMAMVSYQRRHDQIMAATNLTESQKAALIAHYGKQIQDMEQKRALAQVSTISGVMGDIGSIMSSAFGEQFALAKAFGIASATVNAALAAASAMATQPFFPAGLAAWVKAVGMGVSVISQIKSASFSGARDRGGAIGVDEFALAAERRPEFINGGLLMEPAFVRGPANITSGAETERILAANRDRADAATQETLQETTNVTQNFYDSRGNFVEEMRSAVRTGELVPVIREALQAAGRG